MPEGDTLWRIAHRLRPALEGATIVQAKTRRVAFDAAALKGQTVSLVEARGKHLLLHFGTPPESRRVLHSHLGMTGSWHLYRPGQPWSKPAQYASLALATEAAVVVCYSPKILELLTPDQYRRHPLLNRLGPDLLGKECNFDEILRRMRQHPFDPLGVAVLDQSIACGMGNVYKSECLYLEQLDPFAEVRAYTLDEILSVMKLARFLMLRNLDGSARQTRFQGNGPRVWVYGRDAEPCLRCGTTIQMRRQGDLGRSTYFCCECQPARTSSRAAQA